MRAIVIERPHEIRLRDIEVPAYGPHDVLIKSHRVGVCRTDLNILRGEVPRAMIRYPCIPGHEWSGTVAEVGSQVRDLALGDRVVAEGRIPCGRCPRCGGGDTNLCVKHEQLGFTRPGGYGELVVVPRPLVHPLPDHVSLDAGVLIEPAACVLRGFLRARPAPGLTIGTVGVGTLGSIAIQLAKMFSPRAIVAYGIRQAELEFAGGLGVERAIDVRHGDPHGETRRLLPDGLDLVVEAAGSSAAIELATRLVRPGGTIVLLGSPGQHARIEFPAERFMRKDMNLIGNLSYTTFTWTRMLQLVAEGAVSLDPLVALHLPARQFEEALKLMEAPDGVVARIVLEHEASDG